MTPQSTEMRTKSSMDDDPKTCPLCQRVRASEALEWWCDTTPYGDPLDTPLLVCRDAVSCLRIMRSKYERGRL